ncbi:hypothetical protein GF376_01695 [Candidatus Peregrinibacteria bacterium]|nr:hypothetical protein [Candidatus Peregrinibacteria bacterium]
MNQNLQNTEISQTSLDQVLDFLCREFAPQFDIVDGTKVFSDESGEVFIEIDEVKSLITPVLMLEDPALIRELPAHFGFTEKEDGGDHQIIEMRAEPISLTGTTPEEIINALREFLNL